jgi:hypothetical protein
VTRVLVAPSASDDLHRLIRSHSLPPDTPERVRRSLARLERFPLLGRALSGRWSGYRFLLGPWRWLIVVYAFDADGETVMVVSFEDARSSTSVTSETASRNA